MKLQTWQKELRGCIRSIDELARLIPIKNAARLRQAVGKMRLSITPHTLKLINFNDPHDPLLLMSVPTEKELTVMPNETADPIGDDKKSPLPFLVHRYPDRALVHVSYVCAQYCRFCFRRSKTGCANPGPSDKNRTDIVDYLVRHPKIEEAVLSGGDPLMLNDAELAAWLKALKTVKTLRRIRIHTRLPVTLPSRITPNLVETLKRFQTKDFPIVIVTHFNHPREIAKQNVAAAARLVDAGIVVRNQSVLLKGVNDDAETLRELFCRLVDIRVHPYYLHQLDMACGTSHFRVPIERGLRIMDRLQGKTTGLALPKYMLDDSKGTGKRQIHNRR